MSKLVLLDTGVLGFATNPKAIVSDAVLLWIKRLLREGHRPLVPEIADYDAQFRYAIQLSQEQPNVRAEAEALLK
jgi:hypothetical protein